MGSRQNAVTSNEYSPAVALLLVLGAPGGENDGTSWREVPLADYAEMGLGEEHAAELMAMVMDKDALDGPEPIFFGPVHAARALISMRVLAAIPVLIDAMRLACERDDDWWCEDLSGAHGLAALGPAIIDPIRRVAMDQREDFGVRVMLLGSLTKLAESPEHGGAAIGRVVGFMRELLRMARYNDPMLNGFIIEELVELWAAEALPEIRAAFETLNRPTGRNRGGIGGVDEQSCGTLETVEKRIVMSKVDRLRETIGWIESSVVEIKESLSGLRESLGAIAEDEEGAEEEFLPLYDERDLERQEKTLVALRAELESLEAAERRS
jgi:hypothetical protein